VDTIRCPGITLFLSFFHPEKLQAGIACRPMITGEPSYFGTLTREQAGTSSCAGRALKHDLLHPPNFLNTVLWHL
jgi:hypothetical protein